MAQALLRAPTLSLHLHRLGRRAVLDRHRDGLHPRWALRILFLRPHRYLERAAGQGRRREEEERTAARCWPITWSLPRPRWAVQVERAPAPDTVVLALARPWTSGRPQPRCTPAARARMLEQSFLRSPAPKLECPPTPAQVRSRCHLAAAIHQGWGARLEAPQSRAGMAPAAASAETARAEQTPEVGTALIPSRAGESLPPTVQVARALFQRETRQFEEWRSAAAAASLHSPDLVPTPAPTTRGRHIAAPADSRKRSMS